MLFVFLEERWFYVYNRVIKGSMEFSEVLIIEDGSDDYLVYVLQVLLICWFEVKLNRLVIVINEKCKGMVYLRIVQIFLNI